MTVDSGFLKRLRSRGEEVFTQVSAELSSSPRFMQAMAGAMRGKEILCDEVATRQRLIRRLPRFEDEGRNIGIAAKAARKALFE